MWPIWLPSKFPYINCLRYIKHDLNHMSLCTLGIKLSPVPSNSWGCCLASILLCSLVICSIISCCIYLAFIDWYFIIRRSTITIEPRIIPPNIAFLKATLQPERKARRPPVTAPATIWFTAPYYLRIPIRVQSVIEKRPAQRANEPEIGSEGTSEDRCSFFE